MNEVKQIGNYETDSTWDNPQNGRVYSADGLSPTLNTCGGGGHEVKIVEIGKLNNERHSSLANSVLDIQGICPTIDTMTGGNREPKILESVIVASRGRNPKNPSDRTPGNYVEQRLEPNSEGICNTLTSVQKNNLVLENVIDIYNNKLRDDKCCGTITANGNTSSTHCGTFGVVEKTPYRIRKLTPLECWRLMGFTDEDFYKAEKVNSNTQLYKQAGNSIVTTVLEGIFRQMIPNQINPT